MPLIHSFIRLLLLLFIFCPWLRSANDTVLLIEKLRSEQQYSGSSQYDWYDSEIAKLKKENGVVEGGINPSLSYEEMFHRYVRMVPFLLWQLLVLLVCVLFFIVQRPCRLFPFLALLLVCVWIEYNRRSQIIKVIPVENIALHVGPSDRYPVQKNLSYLDEVMLLEPARETSGWKYVQHQDLKGWILYDDAFNW